MSQNPTDGASVFARYSFSPTDLFDPPSLGAAGGDADDYVCVQSSRECRPRI